ncbi:MAG: hypothetical protein M5R38_17945 [Candidatus Methylomirabilis sp.]|nr:hypothetical protein [Candidatus Methylomirabilis sp.]
MTRVSENTKRVLVWLVAMVCSSCALQPAIRPVTDPTMRFSGTGYSALPPQGKDWYIVHHSQDAVTFSKVSPEKMEKYHTFGAGVIVTPWTAKNIHSPTEFPKAVEKLFLANLTRGRFRLISFRVAPFGSGGSYCSQYDSVYEERDNPKAPGVTLEMTNHGFVCLDSSSKFMIDVAYSERSPKGESIVSR